ncbi:NUDIX domain-containing protein [Neobacillus sp. PS3-34]|uniref:NUDIX domain-containing protein n=1 Tax=Neobacillus sp. PS3-34 TaxID=3070678 RepID=UPI0027E1F9EB|nr:NUDIX domain-containing protein [Neobacillus sp. PS3-34]WML46798.1 NUDIX domain-containing protein [Neobacillus sp. PS3-34]
MISQALILQDNKVLMVKQYVQRGDIVWNYPGGGIEKKETPEEACIREVKEETGYDVAIRKLLDKTSDKYTFVCEITGGELWLDSNNEVNNDIIDIGWISLDDREKFDAYTMPLIERFFIRIDLRASEIVGK